MSSSRVVMADKNQTTVLLTLKLNKEDMGKIIGRSGATAKAIRTILRVVGMKNDARLFLKVWSGRSFRRRHRLALKRQPTFIWPDLEPERMINGIRLFPK
jgi:predicted RNA-binding protein YlqC (UPF0109 family)